MFPWRLVLPASESGPDANNDILLGKTSGRIGLPVEGPKGPGLWGDGSSPLVQGSCSRLRPQETAAPGVAEGGLKRGDGPKMSRASVFAERSFRGAVAPGGISKPRRRARRLRAPKTRFPGGNPLHKRDGTGIGGRFLRNAAPTCPKGSLRGWGRKGRSRTIKPAGRARRTRFWAFPKAPGKKNPSPTDTITRSVPGAQGFFRDFFPRIRKNVPGVWLPRKGAPNPRGRDCAPGRSPRPRSW